MAPVAAHPRFTGQDSTVRPPKSRVNSSEPQEHTGSLAVCAGQVVPLGRPPPDRQVQTAVLHPCGPLGSIGRDSFIQLWIAVLAFLISQRAPGN